MHFPTLRVARPTDNIEPLKRFYINGMGFEVLYEFSNYDGFDGLMVGAHHCPYHFEFTKKFGHVVGRAPTADNLLVIYLPDVREWEKAVQRMEDEGFPPVASFNPYWDRSEKTFEDPDGYRIVLQNASWR